MPEPYRLAETLHEFSEYGDAVPLDLSGPAVTGIYTPPPAWAAIRWAARLISPSSPERSISAEEGLDAAARLHSIADGLEAEDAARRSAGGLGKARRSVAQAAFRGLYLVASRVMGWADRRIEYDD